MYEGGQILMTGATGFLGQILIEKLLRSFPRIKTIYIIVREKKGLSAEQRIDKMFRNVIFESLHELMPNFQLKIKVLNGQLDAPNLGLSPEDRSLVTSKVNLVFHCAATLRFDEELKVAINTNMCATQKLLDLAKQCSNLRMFTYVSTAFSHAHRKYIEEIIYKPKTHYTELLKLAEMDITHPKYQEARDRLFKENINTYTLTKAAAEQLLHEEAIYLPVCIFRPSIVVSTWSDPIPGWIDNLYGPTGLVCGGLAGIIHSVLADPNVKADLVPVDFVANALVCAPWHARQSYEKDNSVMPVYNYVSSKDNPITWYDFSITSQKAHLSMPTSQGLWYCFVLLTKHRTVYFLQNLLLHYLFGYIFDTCSWISGNKFRLLPIYDKMSKVVSALEPFSTKEWTFDNRNVEQMWNQLSSSEQNRFPFNIESLNWDDYLDRYVRGTLVHHLNDKMDSETRIKAKKRYTR
ncbi:hypothetical protein WDU94_007461 [Cyamophila willieti]